MILNALVTVVLGRSAWFGDLLGMRICARLILIGHRFRVLVEQVRLGKVPPERPHGPRAARAMAAESVAPAAPAVSPLPRRFRWLVALVPEAINNGLQLLHLLEDPEMAALVAASPGLRRLMRSTCRMLGVSPLPELIRLPPRARRAAAPETLEAQEAPLPRRARRAKADPHGLLGVRPQSTWLHPDFDRPGRRPRGGFSSA